MFSSDGSEIGGVLKSSAPCLSIECHQVMSGPGHRELEGGDVFMIVVGGGSGLIGFPPFAYTLSFFSQTYA